MKVYKDFEKEQKYLVVSLATELRQVQLVLDAKYTHLNLCVGITNSS